MIQKVRLTDMTSSPRRYYNLPYQNKLTDNHRGFSCGDSFFGRSSGIKQNILLRVETTETTNIADNLLLDENLIYILHRLNDLYTRKDHNTFNCKTRASFIYLTRLFRMSCTAMGREIIETAIYLNKTKKWNIYKCIAEANIYFKFKCKLQKRVPFNSLHCMVDYSNTVLDYLQNCLNIKTKSLNLTDHSNTKYFYIKRNFRLKSEFLNILLDVEQNNVLESSFTNYYSNHNEKNGGTNYIIYVKYNRKPSLTDNELKILGEFVYNFKYFELTNNDKVDVLRFHELNQRFKKSVKSFKGVN